jgi:hypothetical protein
MLLTCPRACWPGSAGSRIRCGAGSPPPARPGDIDFPQVKGVARIRRDRYDADGALIGKEIVHAVTSLGKEKAGAEALAGIARGQTDHVQESYETHSYRLSDGRSDGQPTTNTWNGSPQRELTTNPLSGMLGADQDGG